MTRPEAAVGRSTQGEETYQLPVGQVPRALLGACRVGVALEPTDVREGWALFHLGTRGVALAVAVRTPEHPDFVDDDANASAFLRRARSNPRALGELQALLTLALERDGMEGQWWWGDVARAVYGRAAKSHHIDHVRLAATLLSRGQWPAFSDGRARGERPSPWGGAELLRVEGPERCEAPNPRRCRCPLTVRLNPAFAESLAQLRHRVPAEHLQLPQGDHTNPEGRRLSRAALLAVRTTALHHWHAGAGAPGAAAKVRELTLQELLSLAGIDVNAQARRRHLGDTLADVVATLRQTAVRLGVGLSHAPVRARRLLGTVLHLSGPAVPPAPRPAPAPRPPAGTAPLSSNGAARPEGSRAPPLRR
ncbi:MAG TPA: hypothetical protein VNT52_07315 [Acidimicrobiales bacterium]|nr:hypothetical protein [Acidimicrobiales bacterium]